LPPRGRARTRPGHPARPGRRGGPLRPPLRASLDAVFRGPGDLPCIGRVLQHPRGDRRLRRRPPQGPQAAAVITFRDANEADVPAIVQLVTRAYRGEASRAGWTTEADLLDGERIDPDVLLADIRRPGSRVLLAEREGQL